MNGQRKCKVLNGKLFAIAALCVATVPSPSWAGTANIGFAGYRGTETLADFPALIKLPDCAA